MTYDELYEHIVHYIAMPDTNITVHDKRRACLILGAFMEFLLDCADEDVDPRTIDLTNYVENKLNEMIDELEGK